ncbi:MAG: hypothetical protein IT289_05785 [Oligoflexia bacterium]|nr:hypothetical protein [Oligoflexia bacterium]
MAAKKKIKSKAKAAGPKAAAKTSKKTAMKLKKPELKQKLTAKAKSQLSKLPEAKGAAPKGKGAAKSPEVVAAKVEVAEVILTNADGKQYCRAADCDAEGTTDGYCRFHYIALWKRNRAKTKILQGGKLDKYIEDLTAKYPDRYLEILRKDLSSEKDFNLIISEMDVEDSNDEAESEEEASRFIEEVRGGIPTSDDDEGF